MMITVLKNTLSIAYDAETLHEAISICCIIQLISFYYYFILFFGTLGFKEQRAGTEDNGMESKDPASASFSIIQVRKITNTIKMNSDYISV